MCKCHGVRQSGVDFATLDVDQPALGTTDQVGELLLGEATPGPVAANLIADWKCHAEEAQCFMVRHSGGQDADKASLDRLGCTRPGLRPDQAGIG